MPKQVDATERRGLPDLDPVAKAQLLQANAVATDCTLTSGRAHTDGQRTRRKGVGPAIRRNIPVRTFDV